MLTGRKEEQIKLLNAMESDESEFIAVYGRRRVGKTFLVRETFGYKFTFSHTGLAKKCTREQLANFQSSLRRQGLRKAARPQGWFQAFDLLMDLIDSSNEKRKVIFIDELPWMDAPRSGFLTALEHFWNGYAAARKDVVLIVCGSATSWIVNKILKNKGGLHNRITSRIYVKPFMLSECEEYASARHLGMSRRQLMECYMIMGGIPYYWSLLDKSESLAQNIDRLFFSADGDLRHEYSELYASLFKTPEPYISVIEALDSKRIGLSREEIIGKSGLPNNGKLSSILTDLENCGFIRKYSYIGRKSKDALWQLTDPHTLFYFKFVRGNTVNDEEFWSKTIGTPAYYAWAGLAFELLCLLHSRQIKVSLGIGGVISSEYPWHTPASDGEPGAQIDLLIDRSDGVINLCEMKYTNGPFKIESSYNAVLQNKKSRFIESTGTRKAVRITLISAEGVVRNSYSDDIPNKVTADDLFSD